jgi:2-haloacid dehalogenase
MSIFVFDAYGTLFDVHAAIRRYSTGSDAERMSEIWRTKQLEYTWTLTLAGHYLDFWTLTERALDFALARVPSIDKSFRPKLLEAYSKLDAFPDAHSVLKELKQQGHKTAILSNGSPGMLRDAIEAAAVGNKLDAVLSVDAIRMYKPRPEVYAMVVDEFECASSDVTFVSSNRWDVMGAVSFGFSALWVNRGKLPDEYADHMPAQTMGDLSGLVKLTA